MRDEQQQHIALECLKLAASTGPADNIEHLNRATSFYAFVTGTEIDREYVAERDADDAKALFAAIRKCFR